MKSQPNELALADIIDEFNQRIINNETKDIYGNSYPEAIHKIFRECLEKISYIEDLDRFFCNVVSNNKITEYELLECQNIFKAYKKRKLSIAEEQYGLEIARMRALIDLHECVIRENVFSTCYDLEKSTNKKQEAEEKLKQAEAILEYYRKVLSVFS